MSQISIEILPPVKAAIVLDGNMPEYAVGDIHGNLDLLQEAIRTHQTHFSDAHLTFLGDVIDRGPDSLGTLRQALSRCAELGKEDATFIPGNHELLMLLTLFDPLDANTLSFLKSGGGWFFDYFGGLPTEGDKALRKLIGKELARILLGHETIAETVRLGRDLHRRNGNLILVHGGIDPTVEDLDAWFASHEACPLQVGKFSPSWMRDPFLEHCDKDIPAAGVFTAHGRMPVFTVHGHTPEHGVAGDYVSRPVAHRSRLCLDAKSFKSGVVRAAYIETGRYTPILISREAGISDVNLGAEAPATSVDGQVSKKRAPNPSMA